MTQVAVKLPESLLQQVDELVARGVFPSRSSAVRRGLETVVRSQQDRAVENAYEEGYRRDPESEAELAEAGRLAISAIEDEPWEPWW